MTRWTLEDKECGESSKKELKEMPKKMGTMKKKSMKSGKKCK
jgi:hypothetical protein